MSVELREVLGQVEARRVALGAETVGYLVLGLADLLVGAPRTLTLPDCRLDEDGSLVAGGLACTEAEATRALRALLGECLSRASAVTPGLARAAAGAGASLPGLVRELELALVPSSRSAAGRTLRRLHRAVAVAPTLDRLPSLASAAVRPPESVEAPPAERLAPVAPPVSLERPVTPRVVPPAVLTPRPELESRTPLFGSALAAACTPTPVDTSLTPLDAPPVRHDDATAVHDDDATAAPALAAPSAGSAPLPGSALGSLLGTFSISDSRDEGALRAELRRLADVDPTPPPRGPFVAGA